MTRVLLDTGDVRNTASALASIDAELMGLVRRLVGDIAILMPPSVAAELGAAVADAAAGIARTSVRLGASAAELQGRALLAEAGDAASTLVGGLRSGRFMPQWTRSVLGGTWNVLNSGEAEVAKYLHDGTDLLNFVTGHSPVSTLNRFDVPIVRIANNPWFKGAGSAFAILGGVQNQVTAWQDSSKENFAGRSFTMAASGAADFAMYRFPVLAGADALSGGAVRTDLGAFGTMGGAAISAAADGGAQAYVNDVHDRQTHNYMGLAFNVAKGEATGSVHGLNKGLDTWATDVSDGKYGGFMKGFSDVENKAIDKLYSGLW